MNRSSCRPSTYDVFQRTKRAHFRRRYHCSEQDSTEGVDCRNYLAALGKSESWYKSATATRGLRPRVPSVDGFHGKVAVDRSTRHASPPSEWRRGAGIDSPDLRPRRACSVGAGDMAGRR